jgi:hypothetical protein
MNEIDNIWDELENIYSDWGIDEIPFSESISTLGESRLREVFTGRTKEIKEVLSLFKGRERKRLLIYGWIGIGKTAFIWEILDFLKRKVPNILTAYISLPESTDLATASLIALAKEMKDDEWAQQLVHQVGLDSQKAQRKRTVKGKIDLPGIGSEFEEQTTDINKIQFPSLSFEDLLKRALAKYERVVITIDDLDKQDPARVKELLLNAQGMLKSGAWFILTGQPSGLTRDILINQRGLFDLALELENLDYDTTYQMLVNYLNSARPKNCQYKVNDPKAVQPFTPETAKLLCKKSDGVPRLLNRLGSYVLLKASELNAKIITPDILEKGFIYADQQARAGLTTVERMVLNLVLDKQTLSDANVTLEDLQKLKVQEFSEIVVVLDKLVQLDLVKRLPSGVAMEFAPSSLLLPSHEITAE